MIDDCPDDPEPTEIPPYLRGFLYNGHYERKERDRPARVVLYANDLYFGIPKIVNCESNGNTEISSTLAHEVGHHVIATRGYIYKRWEKYRPWNGVRNPYEEKMAEAYASDVMARVLSHWSYRLGKFMAGKLSNFLYQLGLADYWDGDYKAAASKLARAHSLNRENEDAGQSFRHAMEKLKIQTPSPLNASEKEWLLEKYNPYPVTTGKLWLTGGNKAAGTQRKGARSSRDSAIRPN